MSSGSKQQFEDEDDDWFDKDEDDFVVAGTGKPNCSDEAGTSDRAASVADLLDNLKIFSEDYDGNYVDPTKNAGSQRAGTTFTLARNAATKYVQTIPYTKLINIVENDALTLLADVYVQREEFVATLTKKTYGAELLLVLMRIMAKLSTLPMYETIRHFYAILLEQDHFWEQLARFLEQSPEVEKRKKKKKTSIVRPTVARTEMVDVLLKLLTQAKLHVTLGGTVTRFARKLKQLVPDMDTAHRELLAALTCVTAVDGGTTDTISIYPSIKDINQEEGPPPNLKRNIVKGRFQNVDHYLEVHMNLLKEDFMIPLRVGLAQYRAFVAKQGIDETFANDSIRVHYPVKLLLPSRISRRTQKEQLIVVDLDPARRGFANVSARYSRLDLSASKRLLHGSLLLFSSGPTLTDLIVAIVSHRDNADLKNGFINVEIIRIEWGNGDDGCELFNRPLLMVESEIFFEPYHQVFNALRRLRTADSFPLKSYIVDVEQPALCLPAYATSQTNAHFFRYAGVEFDLKQPESWPMETLAAAIGLNGSQYEAYRMALTNRFALIQGPPGTGKTFIGLKIVETLLANTDRQMVLICVTNHALDQFLCGVIRHTESVVRMGNQSKHALLDAYNVKQLNEDQPIDKWLRIGYYNTKQEYLKLLEQFEELQQQGSNDLNKALMECMDQLQQVSRRLNELSQLSSLKAIRDIRVIGMTTTFAARNRVLLELLRTPIVIIEEAAEVLEAHIVASLTKHTQHCILIGDHKQLRPTTSTYVMSARYKLDLSLFERMINNRFSVATMTVQHRMRPELANLLRPTIYRVLEDAEPVTLYPPIVGMRQSLYFLTHSFPEAGARSSEKVAEEGGGGDEKSKRNTFECRFVLALCEYILAQRPYVAEDITILTAYNGQMLQLVTERKARPALQGVRIAVIDSFQGEESRIVLLSLVRSSSHPGDTIGFLAHENRISVALSRAREGLYIVGNMTLLASCSRKWAQIERILREQAAIGQSVPLQCAEHGTVVEVKHPEELEQLNRDRRCACSFIGHQPLKNSKNETNLE